MSAVQVPIIDIGDIFSEDADVRLAKAQEIGRACTDIGFFVIQNHGVPQVRRVSP